MDRPVSPGGFSLPFPSFPAETGFNSSGSVFAETLLLYVLSNSGRKPLRTFAGMDLERK